MEGKAIELITRKVCFDVANRVHKQIRIDAAQYETTMAKAVEIQTYFIENIFKPGAFNMPGVMEDQVQRKLEKMLNSAIVKAKHPELNLDEYDHRIIDDPETCEGGE